MILVHLNAKNFFTIFPFSITTFLSKCQKKYIYKYLTQYDNILINQLVTLHIEQFYRPYTHIKRIIVCIKLRTFFRYHLPSSSALGRYLMHFNLFKVMFFIQFDYHHHLADTYTLINGTLSDYFYWY